MWRPASRARRSLLSCAVRKRRSIADVPACARPPCPAGRQVQAGPGACADLHNSQDRLDQFDQRLLQKPLPVKEAKETDDRAPPEPGGGAKAKIAPTIQFCLQILRAQFKWLLHGTVGAENPGRDFTEHVLRTHDNQLKTSSRVLDRQRRCRRKLGDARPAFRRGRSPWHTRGRIEHQENTASDRRGGGRRFRFRMACTSTPAPFWPVSTRRRCAPASNWWRISLIRSARALRG